MDFSGLEKLSLVDFKDYICCTLFSAGCPFRCPFCHNGELVIQSNNSPITIPWKDILFFLEKRKKVLDGVCITGGEPTLMDDLKDKIMQIKEMGYLVKLDTNGCHPSIVKELYEDRLIDYVAMDIKNSQEKYALTCGVPQVNFAPIKETIHFLINSGIDYEFRTTIIEEFHDENDIIEIAMMIKGAKRYFLQQYVDSKNCIEHGFHSIDKEKANAWLSLLNQYIDEVSLRGYE